jgi:hypothetical protein
MSFPPDVRLPSNAKYVSFVDNKKQFNPNYDIIWSFQYAITGTEAGFCAFLTSKTPASTAVPGHYLGYSGDMQTGGICIAFDTTGLFALSSNTRKGVGLSSIKRNSIIVRDNNDNITLYESLSNLNSTFFITSSSKSYKTMRFRYTSTNKLGIDFKFEGDTNYTELTSVMINSNPENLSHLIPGFSFSSPVSSLNNPGTLMLKNFHTQGTNSNETVEILPFNRI